MIARLKVIFEYIFFLPQWQIGIADADFSSVLASGRLPSVKWWPAQSATLFNADPFLWNGKIIFERMNRWRGSAEIWVAARDGSESRRLIREAWHVSYPCVTHVRGRSYLLYESSAARRCAILEYNAEDDCFAEISRVEEPVVDGTLLEYQDRFWIFGGLADGDENRALHIWWSDSLKGPWIPHARNPVKRDVSSSRPAGGFYCSDTGVFRPAQDCSSSYGGSIVLCRINRLDEQTFDETVICRLDPESSYPLGLHTINSGNGIIVVDGKKRAFHPFAFLLRKISARGMRPVALRKRARYGYPCARNKDPSKSEVQ